MSLSRVIFDQGRLAGMMRVRTVSFPSIGNCRGLGGNAESLVFVYCTLPEEAVCIEKGSCARREWAPDDLT